MNDQDPSASSERRLSEPESSLKPRGLSPGTSTSRSGDNRQPQESTTEPRQLKIVVRVTPAEMPLSEPRKPVAEISTPPVTSPSPSQDADLRIPMPLETLERKIRAEA